MNKRIGFIFCLLKNLLSEIIEERIDTALPYMKISDIQEKIILIPPQPILQHFHSLVEPLFQKIIFVVIYSQDAKKSYPIQVKALSKRNPVPFGAKPNLIADFVAVVINVMDEEKLPEVFIIKAEDVKKRLHKGEKNGRVSYWLQPKNYEEYKGKWEIIGDG
ncbi:MAG: hypothetical protein N2V76_08535 [Methanophagales archaeon]|nr:hypothetical protein [Methanophagales archaeon]